jgi:TatD DNase family protein
MLIDTHCHLAAAEFAADRDELLAAAQLSGVAASSCRRSTRRALPRCAIVARVTPGCAPAYGIHPLYVQHAGKDDLATLREWLARASDGPQRPLAVGEIGLDFFVADRQIERQEYFFVEQLKIARDMELPVLLHVRRAVDQVLKNLRRIRVTGGIAHAFNGSRQQAEEFIRLGFKLGFGGAMTYSGSTRIRRLAAALPLDAIVLETDAPDMPPAWLAGGRNTPAQLSRINECWRSCAASTRASWRRRQR